MDTAAASPARQSATSERASSMPNTRPMPTTLDDAKPLLLSLLAVLLLDDAGPLRLGMWLASEMSSCGKEEEGEESQQLKCGYLRHFTHESKRECACTQPELHVPRWHATQAEQ